MAVDISPEKNGALLKEIKRSGEAADDAKPWRGDKVFVHYVGTLEDGSQFDSSRERGAKFSFTLGKGEVIKGWDLGVETMTRGELAVFTIGSALGYGDAGSPPKIPGGATLTFEVELIDFQGEDLSQEKNGGLTKRTAKAGEGLDLPNNDATVEVTLKGSLASDPSVVVDEREITFTLGEGQEFGVPRGVELALEKMKKQEVAVVNLSPAYGFGEAGDTSKKVPGGAALVYEVTLRAFERAKESWQLDGPQKLEEASKFKDKGTHFFRLAKYEMAARKYEKIVEFLEHEISLKGDQEEERKALLQAGRLNLAMCRLKTEQWIEARNICEKVIEENPASEKAYFRKGESLLHLNDHTLARQSFEKVLALDPDNRAARNKVAVCNAEIKKQKAREKKTFANMFDKFARIDTMREEKARLSQQPMEINEWDKKNKEAEENNKA